MLQQIQMQQKSNECVDVFNKFVREVQQIDFTALIQKAQKIYAVRQFKIGQLTPTIAAQIYQNIYLKFNRNLIPKFQLNWWQNQLRIFVWVLVLYVQLRKTKIQDLTTDDWELFSLIFPHKKQILFEYQSINILKEHGQAKKWINQQDDLYGHLVNEKGLKCKWSQLAKILYIQSQKRFFRTPKQCRQRWLNHLDPAKSKSQWSAREDYILIRYVHQKEKRWAQISKMLQNKRNQHSIKNRFKSLMTKEQKFHKQKLEEAQLISCTYKKYINYFSNLNNIRAAQGLQPISPNRIHNERRPLTVEKSNQTLPNQQNSFAVKSANSKSSQKLMYPFSWHSRHKEQESFIPFRRSQQLIPLNTNDKQLKTYNSIFPSMQQLTNPYTQQGNSLSKLKGQANLPNQNVQEEEQDINDNFLNSFYPPILGQNFINQNNDLSLGNNYQSFLPISTDEFQESPSMENQIFAQQSNMQGLNQNNQNQIDQYEKRIRAEIFLAEDPFELLKPFFYEKKSNSQNKQNQ